MEWILFYEIDPWGERRADLQAGVIASTIAEVNRDRRRRAKPYQPSEFMPSFGTSPTASRRNAPRQSWQEQLMLMKQISAQVNKHFADKERVRLQRRN